MTERLVIDENRSARQLENLRKSLIEHARDARKKHSDPSDLSMEKGPGYFHAAYIALGLFYMAIGATDEDEASREANRAMDKADYEEETQRHGHYSDNLLPSDRRYVEARNAADEANQRFAAVVDALVELNVEALERWGEPSRIYRSGGIRAALVTAVAVGEGLDRDAAGVRVGGLVAARVEQDEETANG